MVKILLEFEDEHFQRIAALARSVSLDEISFIKMLVAAKVKPEKSFRPVGRPVLAPEVKHSKVLTSQLDEIYATLATGLWATKPEEFEQKFRPQILQYQALGVATDIPGLENFLKNHPWTQ